MDGECIEYWIWLQQIFGAGSPKPEKLLRTFGGIREIYEARRIDYMKAGCLSEREIRRLCDKSLLKSQTIIDACMRNGYSVLTPAEMPQRLCNIYAPPCVLYVWGGLPQPDDGVYIAMVGTRNVTAYGVEAATKLAAGLSHSGVVVVSGMALGVDAASHKGALKGGGKTVAVIGCGIDIDYPAAHRELKRIIAQNGAVVSEYPPGARPDRINFPARNRIIAGLSLGTVVIEAGSRSGALITATLAAEMGRDVFAVPGSIFSPMSEGTNRLLRDGAKPVCTVIDIIEEYMGLCPQSIIAQPQEENADAQLSFDLGKDTLQTNPNKLSSKSENLGDNKKSAERTQSNQAVAAQNTILSNAAENVANSRKQSANMHAAGTGENEYNAILPDAAERVSNSGKQSARLLTAGADAEENATNSRRQNANLPTAGVDTDEQNSILPNAEGNVVNSRKQSANLPAAGAGVGLSEMQLKVYNILTDKPKHVDELALSANLELRRVLAVLTTLEIEGFVLSYPGRRYSVMK